MKLTMIPIVIGTLATVTKVFVQRQENLDIREHEETIQTIALLKSAKTLRKVMETCRNEQSLKI